MKARGMGMALLALLALVVALAACPGPVSAADKAGQVWTLQRSIQRALAVAPELSLAQADVRSSRGQLEKADDWPNPTFSMEVTNNIRRMYHEGGYTVDSVGISQPLPLWRLKPQMREARQGLLASQAGADQTRLDVELRAAKLFLTLQEQHDRLQLARKRQAFARRMIQELSAASKDEDKDKDGADEGAVVRYVKPLDRSRLQLLAQTADDDTASARNDYRQALERFRNYLGLDPAAAVQVPALQMAAQPAPLPKLLRQGSEHAVVLRRLGHQLKAAEAGVDLQKAQRMDDPVVSFVHGRNVSIYNDSYSYDSVQLSLSLPLWDQNTAGIEKAQAAVMQHQAQLAIAQRDLRSRVSQQHLQLRQLLDQTRRFNRHVLEPARRLLAQAERHYDVGAAGSLALIDAYNSYFDAKKRDLDLLYQGQQSAMQLRWLLGRSFLRHDEGQP